MSKGGADVPKNYLDAFDKVFSRAQTIASTPYGAPQQQLAGLTDLQRQGIDVMNQHAFSGLDQTATAEKIAQGIGQGAANKYTFDPSTAKTFTANAPSLGNAQTFQGATYNPAEARQAKIGDAATIQAPKTLETALATGRGIDPRTIDNVASPGFSQQALAKYMDPFSQQVTNTTLSQLDKFRNQALTQGSAAATQAGAFGGSRHGVADSLTNQGFADTAASTLANLNSQNYGQAVNTMSDYANKSLQAQTQNQNTGFNVASQNASQSLQQALANASAKNNMSQFDASNQMAARTANAGAQNQFALTQAGMGQQTALANQAANNEAGQFGAANVQAARAANAGAQNQFAMQNQNTQSQFGLANQNAQNTGAQFNAGQSQAANVANQNAYLQNQNARLSSAGLLGQLGNQQQQMTLAGGNAQIQAGNQQQAQGQNQLNTDYQNQLAQWQYPLQMLQTLESALGTAPNPVSKPAVGLGQILGKS